MSWREKARALKREALALSLACRGPRTPWYAKALGVLAVRALIPTGILAECRERVLREEAQ